jgi:hypothetical protein
MVDPLSSATEAKRVPRWKIVAAALPLGIAALVGTVYFWIRSVESRRWEEMRLEVEELVRELRPQVSNRVVLRGVAKAGNAWEDYETAFKLVTPPPDFGPIETFVNHKVLRPEVTRFWESYGPAVRALRSGASKLAGPCSITWDQSNPSYSWVSNLNRLASERAQFLWDWGRGREAADLLLDALQFSEDAARSSPDRLPYCIRDSDDPLERLRDLVLSGALTREDLSEVARELELLDRHLPTGRDYYLWFALANGQMVLESGSVHEYFCHLYKALLQPPTRFGFSKMWRYGFSERIMMADAFEVDLYEARAQAESVGKPWADAWETQQRVLHYREQSANPIIVTLDAPYKSNTSNVPFDEIRERRTRLRLLAMAAYFRSTGLVLELDDPFGSKLFHEASANHLKAWSVGPDGVNHGGDGADGNWGWKQSHGHDMVLEVDR